MKNLLFLIAAGLVALAISPARGETKADTVIGGLSNPTGLAVQPETGHVFVQLKLRAELDGRRRRLIRLMHGVWHSMGADERVKTLGGKPEF